MYLFIGLMVISFAFPLSYNNSKNGGSKKMSYKSEKATFGGG